MGSQLQRDTGNTLAHSTSAQRHPQVRLTREFGRCFRRFRIVIFYYFMLTAFTHASSASTLLVGRQEGHPACKKWVVRYWHGYLSGARCKLLAYGPADATATASSLASLKSRMVLPFLCRLTQVVLEKRPFNGCSSISYCIDTRFNKHAITSRYRQQTNNLSSLLSVQGSER